MGHCREIMYNGMALNDCANRIRYCIQRLGWSFRGEGPGVIYAGVSISLRSYGENVRFAFFQDRFVVESKCAFPLQLIDWGKNKENVDKFVQMYFYG